MKRLRWLFALSFGVAVLAGCVVESPPYYGYGPAYGPPPPPNEVIGVAPAVGDIWIGGFWDWDHDRYRWRSGHWDHPRPGYRWAPRRWENEGGHWRPHGGRWEHH
jgi:hypothetical protein